MIAPNEAIRVGPIAREDQLASSRYMPRFVQLMNPAFALEST